MGEYDQYNYNGRVEFSKNGMPLKFLNDPPNKYRIAKETLKWDIFQD